MFTEKFLVPLLKKVLGLDSTDVVRHAGKRKSISASSIVVVGAVRNGVGKIDAEIRTLQQALKDFKKVSFLIVESDSSDDTPSELAKLKSEIPDFDFVSLGALQPQMPARTQRLAHCRNYYVDQIRVNPKYADVDYVAAADLDRVNDLLTAEAVQTCWDAEVPWDAVTANQAGLYYDVWALRHPDWCPDDCWKQYLKLRNLFGHDQAIELAVWSRMMHLDRRAGFIEVDAAFGGFAIYKKEAFVSGRYVGLDAVGNEVCDNVAFHADLRRKGFRIFINAALINSGESEHTADKRRARGLLHISAGEPANARDAA